MPEPTIEDDPVISHIDEDQFTEVANTVLAELPVGQGVQQIRVPISYEIIRLFSEGLYQSPQKAIEELVSNGFDAGAEHVHVILPSGGSREALASESLFVTDDGSGLGADDFVRLWEVARSNKSDTSELNGRKPIGQFGIGKLAAFVLAWRLTHVSKVGGVIRVVSMNFHEVSGVHQWNPDSPPIELSLHQIDEADAQTLLQEIKSRDTLAWNRLFGPKASKQWTVAVLSEFKDLFAKLSTGRLGWVLRTGLPLASNFHIYLDGVEQTPAKASLTPMFKATIGGPSDAVAKGMELLDANNELHIPGLDGPITGEARLYDEILSKGKAESAGRSHGFFVRVRGRVINLEDELFGLSALSHGAWARAYIEIDVDGLNPYLLSSREGVKDLEPVHVLRQYLLDKFNELRTVWSKKEATKLQELAINLIKGEAVRQRVGEPLITAVHKIRSAPKKDSFYIADRPVEEDAGDDAWARLVPEIEEQPFADTRGSNGGFFSPLASYKAEQRSLVWNKEHPLMARVRAHSKSDDPVELLAASEVLLEAFMIAEGVEVSLIDYILRQRDRALRVLVGSRPPVASLVLSELQYAHEDKDALERATGRAFEVLGLAYTPAGGNRGGTDGLVSGVLGQQSDGKADFRIVYDAKTTKATAVSVQKTDFAALADFAKIEGAQYGFFIAKKFDGEANELAAINRRADLLNELGKGEYKFVTLRVEQLRALVSLHFRFGLPLTAVRQMFDLCGSTSDIDKWLESKETEFAQPSARLSLHVLFSALEAQKVADPDEILNLQAVRTAHQSLKVFSVATLQSQLRAIAGVLGDDWMSYDEGSSNIELYSTGTEIVKEFQRRLQEEGLVDASV